MDLNTNIKITLKCCRSRMLYFVNLLQNQTELQTKVPHSLGKAAMFRRMVDTIER